MNRRRCLTRFASVQEVMTEEFMSLVRILDEITVEYCLPDHSDVNRERYPWSVSLLSTPSLYAARMWEYPYALLSAELQPGMRCADVGCGMTAFTIYLKEVGKYHVVGVDPDVFQSGIKYKGHGVSLEFIKKTELKFVKASMQNIPLISNSFDRVFSLSVMEHVPLDVAKKGMREMARILKPGGRAIITVDVNMFSEISKPLDLIWESGLLPLGEIDLRWPFHRFGVFCDGKQPADVFGMTLIKSEYSVETQYSRVEHGTPVITASLIPTLRIHSKDSNSVLVSVALSLWWRFPQRIKKRIENLFLHYLISK